MDHSIKNGLKAQLAALTSLNSAFKMQLSVPAPPVMGGIPPVPIVLDPALAPLRTALKMQADNHDRLLKLLSDVIDKS